MDRIAQALELVRLAKSLGQYDSNVIGMAAEIIAEERFGMSKAPPCTKAIDGYWYSGGATESVQVKGWSSARIQRYRANSFFRIDTAGGPDRLLVIAFFCRSAEYEVLYFGPTSAVGRLERNGRTRVVKLADLLDATRLDAVLSRADGEAEAAETVAVERSRPTTPEDASSKSLPTLLARAVATTQVRQAGPLTSPRSYGVYEIPARNGGSRQFRFGNHPIRQLELARQYGGCELKHLFLTRSDARAVASGLNGGTA